MKKETAEEAVSIARQFNSLLHNNEYHNQSHTENVVETALDLADEEGLSDHEKRLVRVAGWFHDVGYIAGPEDHESLSTALLTAVLSHTNWDTPGDLARMHSAIRATEVPQPDVDDPVAQVIADADLASLGWDYDEFYKRRMAAYHEFKYDGSVQEWNEETGLPLLEHQLEQGYFTNSAQERYETQLMDNYRHLKREVEEGAPDVLVGGTFDYFHDGHDELLSTAFAYGNPIIGITSDDLANSDRDREVSPFENRQGVVQFMTTVLKREYHREFTIEKLDTKEDIAATADAEIIVISPEEKTRERVERINDQREDNGLNRLEVIVADEVLAEDDGRISSTRIDNGEIDKRGNLL